MQALAATGIFLGILQGAVLAAVLWFRRANRLANRILAVLIGAVALMLLLGDVERRFAFAGHPHLLGLAAPLPFLFGPLVYLYVVALTRPVVRVDPKWLVHALPFVADTLYLAQIFYLKPGDEKVSLALLANAGKAPSSFYLVGVLGVVQALAYLTFTWRELVAYGRKIRGYYSDLAHIDLRWLKVLVVAHVVIWSVVLVGFVLRVLGIAPAAVSPMVALGASAAIFLTGYVSLWQPELVQKARAAEAAVAPPRPPAPPKYQRNRLDEEEAVALAAQLEALMTDKEMYRDGSLTLPALAEALAGTPHMLSQILNVRIGKSFFVFVNSYRAEALKRALEDPAQAGRGILELALEVGFNSKSTLNSFFKRHTGMTPSEYRARARPKTS